MNSTDSFNPGNSHEILWPSHENIIGLCLVVKLANGVDGYWPAQSLHKNRFPTQNRKVLLFIVSGDFYKTSSNAQHVCILR